MPKVQREERIIAENRKARHEYHVVAKYSAGIMLTGTEVKSLRAGKVNLTDSYAAFPNKKSTELFVQNLHISPYEQGNRENHQPLRLRKLLLEKREILKLKKLLETEGATLVPLSLYFSGQFVKVELGLVKGKKQYDKRADIKDREQKRAMQRREE